MMFMVFYVGIEPVGINQEITYKTKLTGGVFMLLSTAIQTLTSEYVTLEPT